MQERRHQVQQWRRQMRGEPRVKVDTAITDADIEAMLESMRRQRPDFTAVERGATDTDRVTVDFEGRIDGVTFQGGTGTDVPFVVGQGQIGRAHV